MRVLLMKVFITLSSYLGGAFAVSIKALAEIGRFHIDLHTENTFTQFLFNIEDRKTVITTSLTCKVERGVGSKCIPQGLQTLC